MSRKVTSYSTLGGNEKSFMTSATTLRELQGDLERNEVPYKGMKLVVGETQVTLESGEAVLPEGEFTLFLTAQKVKSGYDSDDDEGYIDEYDGISGNEFDPEIDDINDCTFISLKDLAVARLKKAAFMINQTAAYLGATTTDKKASKSLADKAREIQNNISLFD